MLQSKPAFDFSLQLPPPLLTTMLLNHVIADKSGTEADVNEHSTQAVNFYHGRGFHTASRSETDETFSPLPVIAF